MEQALAALAADQELQELQQRVRKVAATLRSLRRRLQRRALKAGVLRVQQRERLVTRLHRSRTSSRCSAPTVRWT